MADNSKCAACQELAEELVAMAAAEGWTLSVDTAIENLQDLHDMDMHEFDENRADINAGR